MIVLPRIYPILDSASLERIAMPLETAAAVFLEGGAGILQIRHKGHWSRDFFETAERVAGLCRAARVPLIVNDRADMAMLLAAGLHVGQDDLAPSAARALMGADATIGFSTHNPAQLGAAASEPVDYLAFGPVYGTTSKLKADPVVGVAELARCRALTAKPLVAIGGITLENAAGVLRAGADSLAIIAGLLPATATPRALRERMEEWCRVAAAGGAR
jgi:thiamine-phosphate pyrophosphorylase